LCQNGESNRVSKRVMISGAMAGHPLAGAGNTWAFLQYVLGMRRLGFDTYYVEQLDEEDCIDDDWNRTSFGASANARYFSTLMKRFDLAGHAALLEDAGTGHVGLSRDAVQKLACDTDLLINISGRLHIKQILRAVRRRIYLDLDPGYSQIWQEQYRIDMNLHGHDLYVTVGLNLGKPDCPLPTCGVDWHHILPPVVLEEWTTTDPTGSAYSTVADWRGFTPVEWQGIWYGQKSDEFLRLIDLPRRVSVPLELCLFIYPEEPDRVKLEQHGWQLTSPYHHAVSPDSYHEYIVASRGEFTAVKHGYAAGRTGWFSDRSACYLAAGRPVILQDTGIGRYVPTGTGLLTFTDIDSAAEAIERVECDYARHAAAARAFAREYLDSDRVLGNLLRLAGI
jgi:hypothetical protein